MKTIADRIVLSPYSTKFKKVAAYQEAITQKVDQEHHKVILTYRDGSQLDCYQSQEIDGADLITYHKETIK